jgi:hypothetical protein
MGKGKMNQRFEAFLEVAERKAEIRKTRWSRAGRWAALAAGLVLAVLLGLNAPKLFDRIPAEETTESAVDLTLPQEGPTFSSETAAAGTEDKAETMTESPENTEASEGAEQTGTDAGPSAASRTAVIDFSSYDLISLAEMIPCIFHGVCLSETDAYGFSVFRVIQSFRGSLPEEICVYMSYGNYPVAAGREYICFGVLSANVFLDRIFCSVNSCITPDGDGIEARFIDDIDRTSPFSSVLAALPAILEEYELKEAYAKERPVDSVTGDYIHAGDEASVREQSPYIAKIKVAAISRDYVWGTITGQEINSEKIEAEVLAWLKGGNASETIRIYVPQGSVAEGAEYTVCLRRWGDDLTFAVSAPNGIWPETEIEYDPVMDAGNLKAFDTLEAFEAYERGRENGMTFCYLPKVPEEQYRLVHISKRKDVYFSTAYQVLGGISVPDTATSYAREMLQTLSCTQYLYSRPDGTIGTLRSGCQEIRYDGKTVYYREDWEQRGESSLFLGYSLVFAVDGTAIYMHVPPVGSLEEALVFTAVEKHVIE